jgi:ComF family protein
MLRSWLRAVAVTAVDAVLPPRCLACGVIVEAQGRLCLACWTPVRFLGKPCCAVCGEPFAYLQEDSERCLACLAEPPVYDRARAVFAYDDHTRKLILAFKHGDRVDAAPAYAAWMRQTGADLIEASDVILPVPLHRWRLLRRRYNQAALLALEIGRLSGKPVLPDLLVRRRATPSQGTLGRLARQRNLRGAFDIKGPSVAGKQVVLIDDVLTSGATVNECARVLKRAGATAVSVLTLSRVVL